MKRAIDIGVAAGALLVAAPLLAVLAVAVRATMGAPVLFRQRRAGKAGRPFTLLKLRTMRTGATGEPDAARLTRLGAWLRAWSFDELPQLWNVLRGEMSLVGPRPLPVRPEAFVGEERRRLEVRPGLTGLWQVSGRSELSWDESIELDLRYVDGWSHGLDLAILARTPLAVARGRGAF